MKRERLGTGFDALLVQLGWWACVLGAARGFYFLGPIVVGALLAIQTYGLPSGVRSQAWRAILLLGAIGAVTDSLYGIFGVLTFNGTPNGWIAPLWIIALWCHLATALPVFAPLRSRPLLISLLGAIGGALAYTGGARLGAATAHPEPWVSLLVVGCIWAVIFPLMLRWLVTDSGHLKFWVDGSFSIRPAVPPAS